MLTHLVIRDLAVIERLSLKLAPGLNVLTGKTGAGKSVVVDALDFLRGARRFRARVRAGASSGSVEGSFVPGPELALRLEAVLARHGLPFQGEVQLSRRLDASGRTRCTLQGRSVPRGALAEVGEQLIEICGQHESQGLRTPSAQLAALDRFAGLTAEVQRFGELHAERKRLAAQLAGLEQRRKELLRRRELVEYQLTELTECCLPDYLEMRRRVEEARSVAEVEGLVDEVRELLELGDGAASERLGWALKRVRTRVTVAPGCVEAWTRVEERLLHALDAVHDAFLAASDLVPSSTLDAGELDLASRQLEVIERLARKYGRRPEELEGLEQELRGELEEAERLEEQVPELQQELSDLTERTEAMAAALHEKRLAAANALEATLAEELAALGLPQARLTVGVTAAPLCASGSSRVELSFQANPGLCPAPLARAASGGELARVLLALRASTRTAEGVAVFDEIDAGAGGHEAERIGERLLRASRSAQVLCVTHWPQVAAFADAHWLAHKSSGPVTRTLVARIDDDARLEELSRMLGGDSGSARRHAAHLLEQAQSKGRVALEQAARSAA